MAHTSPDTPGHSLADNTRPVAERFTNPPCPVPDAGKVQDAYRELLHTAGTEFRRRADAGEEEARRWLERFLALEAQLGGAAVRLGETASAPSAAAEVTALIRESVTRRRVPSATYRLQLNRELTFRDARDLVSYLHALGVSDCYTSPIWQARPGSTHGYDVCDHGRLNADLGGAADFDAFSAALREHGMGLVLDVVPNHMGIADPSNAWWMDVLENGPSSAYAPFFDIDWHPGNPNLDNKVLLPFLEDQYGRVLEAGKIQLAFEAGAFFLCYYHFRLPVGPCTYPTILELPLAELAQALGQGHLFVCELQSILTALKYLPPRTESAPEKVAERDREKEVIKRRLQSLYEAGPEVKAAVDAAVCVFNGTPGDPRSFDCLHALVDAQSYRPAFWRVATEEINYRRFFDINELAAVCMERPEVFQRAHQALFRLLAEGKASGLRVDHPDGLWDPARYFRQLQEGYLCARARAYLPAPQLPENLARWVADGLDRQRLQGDGQAPLWPLYVVAEKILCEEETLPDDWAVDGTTGYDFLNAVNGLFVDGDARTAFDRIYEHFAGPQAGFGQLANSSKKMTMLVSMASEINALARQLDRISEGNRRYRDFTLNSLTFALREVIACLPVYRTYITAPDFAAPPPALEVPQGLNGAASSTVSLRDRRYVEAAVVEARGRNPRTAGDVFDFIRDTLLLANVEDFAEADRPRLAEWTMKFQQLTGPVMAKGVEDTAFYVYNRLASLNEVGGNPDRFGTTAAELHHWNVERLRRWPHAMLTTATHDTKRGEDVRARLNVLSELPAEWEAALTRWHTLNAGKKTAVEGRPAPSANDEYLLYQTLLGAWPTELLTPDSFALFRARIAAYMQKATREAKVHTSWVKPNAGYDAAVQEFVQRLLPGPGPDPFLDDLRTFQSRVAFFGYFSSLAQVLLKLTCPGIPDVYQGTELWDLSLVDPDNRRPVDYRRRRDILAELRKRSDRDRHDLRPLAAELLAELPSGRIKTYLTWRTLNFRREHEHLFARGAYLALQAAGRRQEYVFAFARSVGEETVVVAVPRLVAHLTGGAERPPLGPEVWGDTRLLLPPELGGRTYCNLFTGELLDSSEDEAPILSLAGALAHFPVALLACLPMLG